MAAKIWIDGCWECPDFREEHDELEGLTYICIQKDKCINDTENQPKWCPRRTKPKKED